MWKKDGRSNKNRNKNLRRVNRVGRALHNSHAMSSRLRLLVNYTRNGLSSTSAFLDIQKPLVISQQHAVFQSIIKNNNQRSVKSISRLAKHFFWQRLLKTSFFRIFFDYSNVQALESRVSVSVYVSVYARNRHWTQFSRQANFAIATMNHGRPPFIFRKVKSSGFTSLYSFPPSFHRCSAPFEPSISNPDSYLRLSFYFDSVYSTRTLYRVGKFFDLSRVQRYMSDVCRWNAKQRNRKWKWHTNSSVM